MTDSVSPARALVIVALLALALMVPIVAFAAYLWRLGRRTRAQARFPPEGEIVLRRMPVLRGEAAFARARVCRLFAVILVALAAGLGWTLMRFALLIGSASRPG
jgi:hypothetical protein